MLVNYKNEALVQFPIKKSLTKFHYNDDEEKVFTESDLKCIISLLNSENEEAVLAGINKATDFIMHDNSILNDCYLFNRILDIASNNFDPSQADFDATLKFFYYATAINDESFLINLVSPLFLNHLKFCLYNLEKINSDLFQILFSIYGNIIYGSDFLSKKIIDPLFLARIEKITLTYANNAVTFLDLIGCIILRYPIFFSFPTNPFPSIRSMILTFLKCDNFEVQIAALESIRQVSSISYNEYIFEFFTPEVLNCVAFYAFNENEEIRNDALAIITNFSALNDFARNMIIENRFIDNQIIPQIGSSIKYIADTASNFLSSTHSTAIIFADSILWNSLLSNFNCFSFEAKRSVARALLNGLQAKNDEDLINSLLNDRHEIVVEIILQVLQSNEIEIINSTVVSLKNMIDIFLNWPKNEDLMKVFSMMVESGLIDMLADFLSDDLLLAVKELISTILYFFTIFDGRDENGGELEINNTEIHNEP
ncbi:hypothetical protein TRFO_11923 [Tritrichomonas foetus]|uniref:Uncharacterized protein n=1 Tax=Tritrichomonas foetus TaxID=1144522 RepID=A0A1J4J6L4_9EUKA|nr:hypothetical protein TRFO_11923 [Tritrichomonas foetus]|eukprot:OHS93299.1 hypothetical protein TRFO_11923 [Tritrichomonas foetus]